MKKGKRFVSKHCQPKLITVKWSFVAYATLSLNEFGIVCPLSAGVLCALAGLSASLFRAKFS